MIKKFFFMLAILSSLLVESSHSFPQTALAQGSDPVFVGAGDIANCSGRNDEETAKLLDGIAGTVFTLGDNVYPDGTAAQFTDCYGPTWGRHKNRTRPSPGNHDYHTSGASGYYNYFGAAAGDPGKGYYSYNLGAWHIISLNSEVGYNAGSAQEQWLRADLAANRAVCTLAYWHHPRFSTGQHGNSTRSQGFWQLLYDNGADVILNGHDHTYQRFAPQNPSGQADANRGIREFVVGTGGAGLYPFPTNLPTLEVRNNTTFGVLKLTLHANSYDWQFIPIAGQTFTDSGTGNCIGATGPNPTPANTQTAVPTATRTATRTFTPLPPTVSSTALPPTLTRTPTVIPASSLTSIASSPTSPVSSPAASRTSTSIPASSPTTTQASGTNLPPSPTNVAPTIRPTLAVTGTRTPVLPSGAADMISADNFESGDFSAWTGSSTDNGNLTLSPSAALVSNQGLQVVIDDANSVYVADDRPSAEPRYRARFYFDPNSITMATGEAFNIFNGFTSSNTAVMRVEFGRSSNVYVVRASVLTDASTWVSTLWTTISDAPHCIEIDWRAASSGASNGGITLWIDSVQQADLSNVDNDTRRIDRVRLGAVTGIDGGTRGTIFFDAFESRRQTYIGPVGSVSLPTSPPIPAASSTPTTATTSTAPQPSTLTSTAVVISTAATTTIAPSATHQSSTATSTAISASPTPQPPTTTPPAGSVRIVFTASTEDIANPERGFMKQSSIFPDQPLDTNKIRALQPTDTLVWVYFRLDNYRDRSLDQTALNNITSVFTTARNKGLKLVIRFVYNPGPGSTTDPNLANPDAPIELVLQHIRSLQPILASNADVIAVMQVGFVGHWGEWHSSKYLHPLTYRKAIVDALLDALPADRMLQLRYPRYKEIFFQGPLTSQEAFTGTDRSRIGHHNDCFLRDQDDGGTYKSTTAQEPKHTSNYCSGDEVSCWKDFIAQESQFTPVGGETCQYNPPRTDCPNALLEMDMLHWSFINNGYRPEVLNGWTSGGCMNTIRRSLGYRLTLKEAFIPPNIRPGGALSLNVRLSNDGFAAMFNPRPLFVVLQGPGGRYEIPVSNIDPRRWAAGQESTFAINVNLPANVAPGTYRLGLWLPDAYTSLRSKPAYSVRFANTNVWEATTGINILTANFQVVP
ncbi:MAG TPA: DUF4832 domain-containing protein [Anaerolineales bacterium]|nr:DUF4832 domain-containing protein [Anaerolineales bacterium]